MTNYDQTESESTQFVLSYELLCLLQWLAEHDTDKLKKIVGKALASGLQDTITEMQNSPESPLENMQQSMVDFFSTLEALLMEGINEQTIQRAKNANLMPAIDHIDSSVCDDATVRFSLEKATSELEENPEENPKDILYKELLRRWKPSNKNILN